MYKRQQQLLVLDSTITQRLDLKALALYPTSGSESQFLWVTQTNLLIEEWAPGFYQPFSQNNYSFSGIIIHKLSINEFQVFAAQVHNWLVFSTSSRTVESALRAYLGKGKSMDIDAEPTPGQLIVNSELLDHWVQQFVGVGYRPSIMNSFKGIKPVSLTYTPSNTTNPAFKFDGTISLKDTTRSVLIQALSSENKPITLDRYIAGNSSAFGIFRLTPRFIPAAPTGLMNRLDSLLLSNSDAYRDLALAVDSEFAVVTFPESGLLATGEFLFMRKLQSRNSFRNTIEEFAEQGFITKLNESSYYINSEILSKLIGSELSPFTDFYLSFSRDVAVISKRRGLSESVESDRNRRRVIYYDDTYSDARNSLTNGVSGFVWSYTNDFLKFVNPYLKRCV